MRVVICADAHLNSVFPIFSNNKEKSLLRQEEQKFSFTNVINEVKKTDAHLLLIPGDLFCADNVTDDIIEFLIKSFKSIKNTFVMITPGNNDPATVDSPYFHAKWPENVYIFKNKLEALELSFGDTNETVRIYGAGFSSNMCHTSLLRNNNTLPVLDPNYINLLVMHGSICNRGTKNNYNPIFIEDLNSCGFDFCALGHKHDFTDVVTLDRTNYAYTGPCEGRNFHESGARGVLSGSITKDIIDLHFSKTSVREYINTDLDISDFSTEDSIINEIKNLCCNPEYIYNVNLTGSPNSNIKLSTKKINSILSSEYFYIKINPAYKEKFDIELLKQENSLRGCFVRHLDNKASEISNPDVFHDALLYGLKAFESEVLLDENS